MHLKFGLDNQVDNFRQLEGLTGYFQNLFDKLEWKRVHGRGKSGG